MTSPLHEERAPGTDRALPDTQQGMRRRNLARVMHAVSAEGPLSRAATASRIGLTRAAVSTLVDDLIRWGLLEELGPERPGRVGRPGSALAVSGRGPAGIGAEIGVDHLAVCTVDLRGVVRARAVRHGANRGRSPQQVAKELVALVHSVAEEAEREGLWPAGLAVAVPGLVARDGRTVVRAPNLGWHDADLGALFPGNLPLTVDNEANFGALAELWLGEGTPRDFLHVSAEIGIGAAVVVDGRLLRGTRGFAGELGHVPVRPDGRACPCGGRGCLEQYAGEEAVLRAAGLEPGEDLVDQLAGRAEEGDENVRVALRDAGTALGVALTGAVNLLDPETVVLGGALSDLSPWLLPSLQTELTGRAAGPVCPVAVSRLGPQGPLLGAAHSVVRAVLDDPTVVAERP
ncbi:ROK family transcriptional regulator [Streptomyces pluripotens]|uniref:ROK family transcriptional regulator n=1 Tax=Streptomyces pluripotens TaxID=1355015 RepID=A0A221P5Y8_9ACTN|nr:MULTISPECIES: ROK family transcriptional regulator [Streptomyces]ARP73420.1 ROK family protein [Streptomyces pluripotens]ASN27671.1 ROK family transcriptional regulator [Streptomyces pluripotens]KIE26931.1 ROK family protein [Streptomyces sp. MUSC 125]MCH0557434.1 ROK family transcriptional regulator [Streptomyces sp. MUM 16J]